MQAAIHLRIPHRGVMGGVLITLGVAGEVIFEGIVSHTVKQIQQAADLKVAELYERAAKSELELERVRAEAMEHQSEAE